MIDFHAVGNRSIDACLLHMTDARLRIRMRDRQFARRRVPIAHGLRRDADAEARHQAIEKAIEVVGSEHHHEFRRELANPCCGFGKAVRHLGLRICAGIMEILERRVRCAQRDDGHCLNLSESADARC